MWNQESAPGLSTCQFNTQYVQFLVNTLLDLPTIKEVIQMKSGPTGQQSERLMLEGKCINVA